MGSLIPILIKIAALAATHGQQVKEAVDVGMSVEEALKQHAPEIHDLLSTAASLMPEHPAGGSAVVSLGKSIFAPHMTTDQEKAWMDRASQSFG